jgi:hypothetical protein
MGTGQIQYKPRSQLTASLQTSDWLHLPVGVRHDVTPPLAGTKDPRVMARH